MPLMNQIKGIGGKLFDFARSYFRNKPAHNLANAAKKSGGVAQGVKNFVKDPAGSIFRSAAPERTFYTAKRLFTNPKNTLAHGWKGMGKFDKLMLAGNAAMSIPGIINPEPGEGRAQAVGRLLGGSVGWVAGSRLPFLANAAAWMGGEAAGGMAGKMFGKTTGLGRAKKIPQMDSEQSVAAKLAFDKSAETNEDLKAFTKKLIRQRQVDIAKQDEKKRTTDVSTVTTTDPTGTYERSV